MKIFTKSELETEFGADRLAELCGGLFGIRGTMTMTCTAPPAHDAKELTGHKDVLDFIGSDSTIDRYQETIEASGWKLENYRKNPVFQNSHKYGDVLFTLGKSLVTEVRSGKLFQRIAFATEVNPVAKIAHGLYQGGFLNAVSVGFIPIKWENGNNGKDGTNGTNGTNYRRKYLEQELLELSAVAVPANPNALVMGLKSGVIDKGGLEDLADFLKQFCSDKAGPDTHAGASGVGAHEAHALRLSKMANWVLQRA